MSLSHFGGETYFPLSVFPLVCDIVHVKGPEHYKAQSLRHWEILSLTENTASEVSESPRQSTSLAILTSHHVTISDICIMYALRLVWHVRTKRQMSIASIMLIVRVEHSCSVCYFDEVANI